MKLRQLRFDKPWRILPGTRRSQAAVMIIRPGDAEGGPGNRHPSSDQWLLVLDGTGEARVNGRRHRLTRGSLLLVEKGERHEIRATGRKPLKTLNIYAPPAY